MNPAFLEDASGFRGYAERLYRPASEAELVEMLREASRESIPVTIAGAGTGVTGGRVAQGGAVLSLEQFTRLEVRSGTAAAGAGVLLRDLHAAAAALGLFFPPDPTETGASIGGIIATNASGSRSFRYGPTSRHVLALRVALMDGTVLEARRGDKPGFPIPQISSPRSTKNSAGYRLRPDMDWIELFAGSEGTLGVVMEAELALLPMPAALLAGVVFFASDEACLSAVDAWRPTPGLRMIEYFDCASLAMLRARFDDIPPDAAAALLIEQEMASEDAPEVEAWLDRLEAAGAMVEESWSATSAQDRERFRRFRHTLPELVNDTVRRNGFLKLGSDYAVPLDHNRAMLAFYHARLNELFPARHVIFGHIGDAHLHVNLLPTTAEEFERGRELMLEFARRAVEMGGTVSAEHGLGKRKAPLLALQYSHQELEAMKAVKRRLDPAWLLGRGTLFEQPSP